MAFIPHQMMQQSLPRSTVLCCIKLTSNAFCPFIPSPLWPCSMNFLHIFLWYSNIINNNAIFSNKLYCSCRQMFCFFKCALFIQLILIYLCHCQCPLLPLVIFLFNWFVYVHIHTIVCLELLVSALCDKNFKSISPS